MLGAAQPDPLGPEPPCDVRLLRHVGVRADAQLPEAVGPGQDRSKALIFVRLLRVQLSLDDLDDFGFDDRDIAFVDVTGRAVDGKIVALAERLGADLDRLAVEHFDGVAAGHADLAHLARHDRCVGGHPASRSQEPRRRIHPVDVVGTGLLPHEHHPVPCRLHVHGTIGRQRDLACRSPGPGRQAFAEWIGFRFFFRIENRVQILRQLIGTDPLDGFFFPDQPFLYHVDGDFHRRDARAFANPGLQHVELAFLDGELQVQHVAVMFFEFLVRVLQVFVSLRHVLGQRADRQRRADARHDVFTLRVHQTFTEKRMVAGTRAARERHPGTAGLPHVAEHHRHHVDRGPPRVGNAVQPPVGDRTRPEPGRKHGVDRHAQLIERLVGELFFRLFLDQGFEAGDQLAQMPRI